jgi:hypothetical protein
MHNKFYLIILLEFSTFFLWTYSLSANEVENKKSGHRAKKLSLKLIQKISLKKLFKYNANVRVNIKEQSRLCQN